MILKNWRLLLELALLLLLLVFFFLYRYEKGKITQTQQLVKAKTVLQHPQAVPLKTFKDTSGDTHFEVLANSGEIPESSLKDTAVTNRTFVDTAAKAMKIKASQVEELTRENLQLKAENIQLKAVKDTAGNTRYAYADKWLQLMYDTKTNKADVSYHVHLTTGKFTPASIFPFTSKPPVLDFSTDDPRAVINNVDHFSATIPEAFFGFSADVKAMYLYKTMQIIPSIGANVRLGRWHVEQRAFYTQKLNYSTGLVYDLLKF